MHFSTLALFIITLPAAAYAAAYPEPFLGLSDCSPLGQGCNSSVPCCEGSCIKGVGRFRGNNSDALSLMNGMLSPAMRRLIIGHNATAERREVSQHNALRGESIARTGSSTTQI